MSFLEGMASCEVMIQILKERDVMFFPIFLPEY